MKLSVIGVALFSVVLLSLNHAYANERMSSSEKRGVFSECNAACIKNQNEDPDTVKIFGDVPFVTESYCGCYCTRIAMRMSKESLLMAGRISAEGGEIGSNQSIMTQIEQHSRKCLDTIFD